jgi:hypothetical protein
LYLFNTLSAVSGEQDNLKALYRRGQAYLGSGHWQAAASDLERAARLSASDPAQQKLIREKLQEAKDQVGVQRAAATQQQTQGEALTGDILMGDGEVDVGSTLEVQLAWEDTSAIHHKVA